MSYLYEYLVFFFKRNVNLSESSANVKKRNESKQTNKQTHMQITQLYELCQLLGRTFGKLSKVGNSFVN